MLTVNREVFQSFTPEDRKIVREAAAEATKWQVETVRKGLIPPDLSALDLLRITSYNVCYTKLLRNHPSDAGIGYVGKCHDRDPQSLLRSGDEPDS